MHLNCSVFDCHCDTLTVRNLFHTKSHLNIREMKKYRRYIQVFAICAEKSYAYTYSEHYIKRFERMLRLWNMEKITDKASLKGATYGAILSLEGANAIDNLASLEHFYNKGVRLVTLTWNNTNSVASSIMAEEDGGLSDFGKEVIKKCEDLGIVVDLSHISDKSFFDVCDITQKPFVCSHSNSRAINRNIRNITDTQFKEIVKRGGCVGINFYHEFLDSPPSLSNIISHIEHFCTLGGEKCIGIGSDFDGINRMPDGCRGPEFIYDLSNELLRLNYKEELVNDILFNNFFQIFLRTL